MTPKGKMKSYMGCLWTLCLFMALVVMFLMFATVMSGCKHTEYVEVPVVHTDTLIVTNHQKDSVWLHDSIYQMEKGDTVLIEKWHTKYKEKEVHDTIYKVRVDSVWVPYPVEKHVAQPLTWWQKTRIHAGETLLVLLGAAAGIGVWKLYRKYWV